MTDIPVLSIVMPVFNRTGLVREMMESIKANSFQDWELIAVDDGSERETLNFLDESAAGDPRIRVFMRTELPKGPLTCRNIGFENARGQYIVFFDSDDYITPDCLGNRVRCMEQNPDLDFMVFPAGEYVDGRIDCDTLFYSYGYQINKDDIKAFCRRILPFVVWNNIYRLDSLKRHGIRWDTKLRSLEDADYNMQTLLAGMKYRYGRSLPDYGYRIAHNTQALSRDMSTHNDSNLHAVDKFYASVTGRFGHKYDRALYYGVMSVFTMVCRDSWNMQFINGLHQVLRNHNRWHSFRFGLTIKTISLLSVFMSKRKARQIATSLWLITNDIRFKILKPKRIRKIMAS